MMGIVATAQYQHYLQGLIPSTWVEQKTGEGKDKGKGNTNIVLLVKPRAHYASSRAVQIR
jgi:hypothetical protein